MSIAHINRDRPIVRHSDKTVRENHCFDRFVDIPTHKDGHRGFAASLFLIMLLLNYTHRNAVAVEDNLY